MISVYSDGSSHARGGLPGGWGFVIVRDGADVLAAGGGNDPSTTNNVMEMTGALRGLLAAQALGLSGVELVSDSKYVLGMASGAYSPSTNHDLAAALKKTAREVSASFRWVKGHSGDRWNERVDSIATFKKKDLVRSLACHQKSTKS